MSASYIPVEAPVPVPSDPRLLKPELEDPGLPSPLLEPDIPLVNEPKLDVVCRFLVVAVEVRLLPVPEERPSSPVVLLEVLPRLHHPPMLPELLVGIEKDGMLRDGNEPMEPDPLNWRFSTSIGAAVARSAQPAIVNR